MEQNYNNYTDDDLSVWGLLFNRQLNNLQHKSYVEYLNSLDIMSEVLNSNTIPDFRLINQWFKNKTGWEIKCVPGLIPVEEFFELLNNKIFPSSSWLRPIDKLDYLEEPDMFHDIFGHIPLLSNQKYSDFIHEFGKLGYKFINDKEKLTQLQRLYWFTIEFGLIGKDKTKIYGAGIISSYGETNYSLEQEHLHIPYDLTQILNNSFLTTEIQQKYYVINDFDVLNETITYLKNNWI